MARTYFKLRKPHVSEGGGGSDAVDADRLPYGGTWDGIVGVQDVDPSTYTKHNVSTANGGSDATGTMQTTATRAQINSALAAAASAGPGKYVELASGTFSISGGDLLLQGDGTELRGQVDANGLPSTLLNFGSAANHMVISKGTDWDHYYYASNGAWTTRTLTAAPSRGATSVTATAALTGGSGGTPVAGGLMLISAPKNAPTIDVEDTEFSLLFSETVGATRHWMVIVKITSVNTGTNTIDFWPPLNADYLSGTCQMHWRPSTDQLNHSGIRNLSFKCNNGGTRFTDRIVQFSGNNQCWIDNCYMQGPAGGDNIRVAVQFYMCFNCELTHSKLWDSADSDSSLYGMNLYGCSGLLIVNNEFTQLANAMMILNTHGSAIAYNYNHDQRYLGFDDNGFLSQGIFFHGSHCHYNLFEGNWSWHYIDEIAGSNSTHSRNTLFCRERLPGYDTNDGIANAAGGSGTLSNNVALSLLDHQDNITVAACVLGTSGKQTTYEKLTSGTTTEDEGIFRLDSTTKSTIARLGNYNTVTGGIPAAETTELNGNTVATSYLYPSKPAWFGSLPWPWVTPSNFTQSNTVTNFPAGYRATNGTDPS